MTLPCKECIVLAICKHREEIKCTKVDDFAFFHDYDPGFRGAKARASKIGEVLFNINNYISLVNPVHRTVSIFRTRWKCK